MLRDFLDSLRLRADRPDRLEVVLCRDADDAETAAFRYEGLALRPVVAPPGATMGRLNNLCLEAATGRYVMLVNDDIVVRTQGFDSRIAAVLEREADGHVLVHVNDGIFGASLCTFPLLSRRTVERIGLCPDAYRRYAIDDHIMHVFRLLRELGHSRIRYLEDVLFEHLNYTLKECAQGKRAYVPRTPPEADWALFHALRPEREQAALRLALEIDGHDRHLPRYRERLAQDGDGGAAS